MKKVIIFLLFWGLTTSLTAQTFLGTIAMSGNKLQFKIKPTGGSITSVIGYMQFDIRYSTATSLTYSAVTPNTVNFPGLSITEGLVERSFGGYKYKRFIAPATINSQTYANNSEYQVFEVTLAGTSPFDIQLVTDYTTVLPNEYYFTVVDDAANPLADFTATTTATTLNFYPSQVGTIGSTTRYYALNNVVLPLALLEFKAQTADKTAILNWKTADERNVSHFEIERSMDSKGWEKVGSQKAGIAVGYGNTEGYTFTDAKAFDKTNAPFYRLKMMDNDGSFTYSPVRQVRTDKAMGLKIYPNPAKSFLQVEGIEATESWQVVDVLGKVHDTFAGPKELNLAAYTEGVYFVKSASGKVVQFVVSE
jgi:hypothetical protein